MIDLDLTPQRRLDARVRNVRGVMHVAGVERAFELSDVAALVWRLADGKHSIRDMGEAIASEYEVEAEDAARDAADLLSELERNGLVELREP